MTALFDAKEYLIAGLENQAEWWEHLGDAHRDYAALALEAIGLEEQYAAAEREVERLKEYEEQWADVSSMEFLDYWQTIGYSCSAGTAIKRLLEQLEALRRHAENVRDGWLIIDGDDAHLMHACEELDKFLVASSPAKRPSDA